MQIIIIPENLNMRIDKFLVRNFFSNGSRAEIIRKINSGDILVNQKIVKPSYHLKKNDVVEITARKIVRQIQSNSEIKLEIIFQNNDFLVINKPDGLTVHPLNFTDNQTLASGLLAQFPEIKNIGDKSSDSKLRPGIVHRLDKEASGTLIIAKNETAFASLKHAFAERKTIKRYTVLVVGRMVDDNGTITFPIARSTTHARMAARPLSQDGKEAITHYDVLKRYANATLLDVRIETGRTHQIRAHFFALGNPVAGDTLYVQRGIKQLALNRLFLHARELTIPLPSGETRTFSAPLPKELEEVLTTLHEI